MVINLLTNWDDPPSRVSGWVSMEASQIIVTSHDLGPQKVANRMGPLISGKSW